MFETEREFMCAGVALLAGAALALGACSTDPRNGLQLTKSSDTTTFAGFDVSPGTPITYSIFNAKTGNYDAFLHTKSSSSVTITDQSGQNWYSWSVDASLPLPIDGPYWQAGGDGWVKAQVMGTKADGEQLVTFDTDAGACIQSNETSGGAIVSHCKSRQTPVATIFAPCGKLGEFCCFSNSLCVDGSFCSLGVCSSVAFP